MKFATKVAHALSGVNNRVSAVSCAIVCGIVFAGCAQTPPATTVAAPPPVPQPIVPANPDPPSAAAVPAPSVSAPPRSSSESAAEGTAAIARRAREARTVATTDAFTPAGKTRYACEKPGSRVDIVLPEGSARICSRFPAMGPCQYERDACRASGGRVIRFDGVEITKDVELEYDKQVQRFRLNAG